MSTPHPQTLCDRAKQLHATYGTMIAASILGLHYTAIWRMRKRDWKRGEPGRKRPMPSDFPIQAHHMTNAEIRAHYVAGGQAVSRWCRELRGRG